MKRLIPILLFVVFIFASCEKESCWRCQHINVQTGEEFHETYCGITQTGIVILEENLLDEHIVSHCSEIR